MCNFMDNNKVAVGAVVYTDGNSLHVVDIHGNAHKIEPSYVPTKIDTGTNMIFSPNTLPADKIAYSYKNQLQNNVPDKEPNPFDTKEANTDKGEFEEIVQHKWHLQGIKDIHYVREPLSIFEYSYYWRNGNRGLFFTGAGNEVIVWHSALVNLVDKVVVLNNLYQVNMEEFDSQLRFRLPSNFKLTRKKPDLVSTKSDSPNKIMQMCNESITKVPSKDKNSDYSQPLWGKVAIPVFPPFKRKLDAVELAAIHQKCKDLNEAITQKNEYVKTNNSILYLPLATRTEIELVKLNDKLSELQLKLSDLDNEVYTTRKENEKWYSKYYEQTNHINKLSFLCQQLTAKVEMLTQKVTNLEQEQAEAKAKKAKAANNIVKVPRKIRKQS